MTKLRGSVELLGGNRNPCDATSVEPCVYVHRVTPLSSFPATALGDPLTKRAGS